MRTVRDTVPMRMREQWNIKLKLLHFFPPFSSDKTQLSVYVLHGHYTLLLLYYKISVSMSGNSSASGLGSGDSGSGDMSDSGSGVMSDPGSGACLQVRIVDVLLMTDRRQCVSNELVYTYIGGLALIGLLLFVVLVMFIALCCLISRLSFYRR